MRRNEGGWINCFVEHEALWMHSGDSKQPHVVLASGMHSNSYFESERIMGHELLSYAAARDLYRKFSQFVSGALPVQAVVGPQTGATKLAELLAAQVDPTGRDCFWASPEKGKKGRKKVMVFSERERWILPHKSVLLCEDVITTGGSVALAAAAVTEAKGIVLPFVLTLVNRSGLREIDGRKIFSLIDCDLALWTPEECPLCKKGSKAIRPNTTH